MSEVVQIRPSVPDEAGERQGVDSVIFDVIGNRLSNYTLVILFLLVCVQALLKSVAAEPLDLSRRLPFLQMCHTLRLPDLPVLFVVAPVAPYCGQYPLL